MKFLVMLCTIGAMTIVNATTISGETQEGLWDKSYKLEIALKYKEASKILIPLMNKNETEEMVSSRMGWLSYLQGNYRDSIKNYNRAIKLNPKSIDYNLGITLPFLAQKRYRSAIKYTEAALKLSPNHYASSAKMMYIYTLQKKWRSLNEFSTELSKYYPNVVEPLVYMARSNNKIGREKEAEINYQKVLRLMPTHLEALKNLGKKYKKPEGKKKGKVEKIKEEEKKKAKYDWFKIEE